MLEACFHIGLMVCRIKSFPPSLLRVLAGTSIVAALFVSTVSFDATSTGDTSKNDFCVFHGTCEFQSDLGQGRLNGLLASDGSRHRIAIYWIEPDVLRESRSFVRYADVIIGAEVAYYWIYPGTQGRMPLSSDSNRVPLVAHDDSLGSIVRSALAIAMYIEHTDGASPLEVARFFRASHGLTAYTYETAPEEADGNDLSSMSDIDIRALNTLPSGRRYSKERQADGSLVWRVTKALSRQPIATATIRPATGVAENELPIVFDPNTLGEWSLIPQPYRAYWSFDSAYSRLSESTDARDASRELYKRIESYLNEGNLPGQVHWAMDRLAIKTALMTNDMDRVRRSVQRAVEGLCADPSLGRHRCLLELARISGLIQKRYPEESQEWLRPFVGQVVEHAGREGVANYLERLMPAIKANKWRIYGSMLLEEIRRQGIMDEHALRNAVACVEEIRLAQEKQQWDNSESLPSVRDYLAQLDGLPPKGVITMDGVRHILEKGFAKCYPDGASQAKHDLVEDVIGSLRLIVGEGPFCGDSILLTESIGRFAESYVAVIGPNEPISAVLATFVALSFCDISTAEDHETLTSQFHRCMTHVQSLLNIMLNERGLDALVTPQDVETTFQKYEREFQRYVDDPLWPSFKFPWTNNEAARLTNNIELRLIRLQPILDDISLKVKYGGSDATLKARPIYEICRLAEQLVAETAFLRRPLYPGVSCRYRGGYGLTAEIEGPLYRESDRPREKFKAMKYFHLGHRLEDIVERERELARISETQEPSQ